MHTDGLEELQQAAVHTDGLTLSKYEAVSPSVSMRLWQEPRAAWITGLQRNTRSGLMLQE